VMTIMIAATVALITRLLEAKMPQDMPDFVVRTPYTDTIALITLTAGFAIIVFLAVLFGDYSVSFWLNPATGQDKDLSTLIMLASPIAACVFMITGTGRRLMVRGDMLEFKKRTISKTRVFSLHEIERIERSAVSSNNPQAKRYLYHFLDINRQELCRLDEHSQNLSRLWDLIYQYRHIQSCYDRSIGAEIGLVSSQREEQILAQMKKQGMAMAPAGFTMVASKRISNVLLTCGIFLAVVALIIIPVAISDPSSIYATSILMSFSFTCFIGVHIANSRRIVVFEDKLFIYSMLRGRWRHRVLAVSDITDCRQFGNGSIELYNGKKKVLSIPAYMLNSQLLMAYLKERGINMPEKRNIGFGEQ